MPTPGTPSPEQLYILLARAEREGLDVSVIERLTVMLHFAEHQYSFSETCRHFGISRSTLYRWIEHFNPENLSTLADKSCVPLTLRQSAIDSESVELIRRYRMQYPQMGKGRISKLLLLDHAVDISPSSVGRVIERECLYFADTPFHWKKRIEKQTNAARSGEAVIAEYEQSPAAQVEMQPQPEPAMQRVTVEAEEEIREQAADTALNIKPFTWRSMKRLIIVSSVVTNVAFVSLLLGSALIEHVSKPVPSDVQTETLHAAPADHYIP